MVWFTNYLLQKPQLKNYVYDKVKSTCGNCFFYRQSN